MNFPWHNRQSLIAGWETSFQAQNLSGAFFTNFTTILVKDGSTSNNNPIIVPRAYRLTRYAIRIKHNSPTGGQLVTLGIGINTECGAAFDFTDFDSFNLDASAEAATCQCGRLSVPFDVCHTWKPSMTVGGGGIRDFFVRLIFFCELR